MRHRDGGWLTEALSGPLAGALTGSLLVVLVLSGCGTPAGQQAEGIPASSGVSAPARTDSQTARTSTDDGRVASESPDLSDLPDLPDGTGATDAAGAAAGRVQDPTAATETAAVAAAPVRVRIPSLGVDAPLETLSVDAENVLQPPVAWDAAGWYDQSPVPGERGPSVIAGHLVAPDGPAVFVDLGDLVPGDLVDVERADGSIATFTVNRTISAERTDSFPTSEIYGPTPDAQLRLITCDGEYDPARGHWTRNMVVFATEVAG